MSFSTLYCRRLRKRLNSGPPDTKAAIETHKIAGPEFVYRTISGLVFLMAKIGIRPVISRSKGLDYFNAEQKSRICALLNCESSDAHKLWCSLNKVGLSLNYIRCCLNIKAICFSNIWLRYFFQSGSNCKTLIWMFEAVCPRSLMSWILLVREQTLLREHSTFRHADK